MNRILRNLWLAVYTCFCKTKCVYRGSNGKTVKILANGPSLKDDLDNLIETDSVSVLNFFGLNDLFWTIKPNHYVLADPVFFEIDHPVENVVKLYDAIEKIDWKMTFYVPLRYYSAFRNKVKENPHIDIKTFYRFPLGSVNTFKRIDFFLYRKGLNAPIAQNVLIPSIFLMINEGFEKIYLYGADHSWLSQMVVDEKNRVCLVDKHFYDKSVPTMKPWLTVTGAPFKLHELMKIFHTVFATYQMLGDYAKSLGKVRIINMTKHSFIDAFER